MVKHLGVVGAGTMGAGIAQVAALAGIDVALYDVNATVLRQSLERLKRVFSKAVEKGELTQEQTTEAFTRIHPRTRLTDLSHSEIIVEAVIEDLRVKKDLFKHLESGTKPSTILASNTSSLSLTAIASATQHPEKVVGLHFRHPIDVEQLVELVRTEQTSPDTLQRSIDFSMQLGKTPVIVNDAPGFIINRLLQPFHGEALRILSEHIASVEQIDRIVKTAGGFAMGPFESLDSAGLDVMLSVTQSLYERSCGEPRYRIHPLLKQMVESGLVGEKSGQGFYHYVQNKS